MNLVSSQVGDFKSNAWSSWRPPKNRFTRFAGFVKSGGLAGTPQKRVMVELETLNRILR